MHKSKIFIVSLSILCIASIYFLWVVFFTDAGYSDGDSVTHYLIARYAFSQPVLFLHHWGKPFFTTFAAPFAYFGFNGVQVFNVICGLISAFFSFKIAQALKLPFAPLAIIFTLAAPVYYINIPTGLTEIFFSLVLVSSVYLVIINKQFAAAILVSFLPFARSEGFLILPLFALFFLYRKSFKVIPLLAFGTLTYSIIGYFVYDDFGWLFSQNPYHNNAMYGHGDLLYFVSNIKSITGIPLIIVFLAGLLFILRCTYIHLRKNTFTNLNAAELLLIFGSFFLYFIAHTIFWWKGMFASLGMTRVMAGVIPVFAVGALRGLTIITGIIYKKYKPAAAIIAIIFAFIVLQVPFVIFGKVEKLDPRLITVKEACNWLKENNVSGNQVFYSHPFTVICMDINPYDKDKSRDLMFVQTEIIEDVVPKDNFVVWDSQFGPNEMHTPLERLQDTAHFKFIKNFAPQNEIIVLGGRKFEVKIFMRK